MSGRILILGGTGRLGCAMSAALTRRGRPFDAPGRAQLDLGNLATLPEQIDALAPSAILNLAGFTDVGAAERPEHHAAATMLNAELPGRLAAISARLGVPLVHVSTDYVFDGEKDSPYREDDPVHPIQVYGVTKLEGEKAAIANDPRVLVARVSTLYGRNAGNRPAYVDAILAQARDRAAGGGGVVSVVERPLSSPTYAPDVAEALIELLDRGATGVVHVVNDGAASRLKLASATVALAGLADCVLVSPRPEAPGSLARPAYSVLDTTKLRSLIGRNLPAWQDALRRYLGDDES